MKKSILLMAVLIALVSLCLVFASCDSGSSSGDDPTYTVTFDLQGHGTAIEELTNVPSGFKITEPTAPTATGYTFGGWYKEAACTNAWNFSTDTVTKNVTLYAKWQPEGVLAGVFTVNVEGKTVHFSQGNLYYDGDSFEFEENQYSSADSWDANHVSHFYWSKTASVAYAASYSDDSADVDDVFFTNDPDDAEKAKSGFTVNGVTGKYRTLSQAEWVYLLYTRSDANKFAKARVNKVNGLLIFPDSYILPDGYTTADGGEGMAKVNKTSYQDAPFPEVNIPAETWAAMEEDGVVFLPAAGYRNGADVSGVGSGLYWSATRNEGNYEYSLHFDSSYVNPAGLSNRFSGQSVRLVCGVSEN